MLTRLAFVLTLALLPLHAASAAPVAFERLLEEADAVAAIEVLSVDGRAMAADGPMYVEAKVLKSLKGRLRTGRAFRFGASAWQGPTFEAGQQRVVFLDPVPRRHGYYQRARWESLDTGKIDLFISPQAIDKCSIETLTEFLRELEPTTFPVKAEFTAK